MATTRAIVEEGPTLKASSQGSNVEKQGIVCQNQVAWTYDGSSLAFSSLLSGEPMHSVPMDNFQLIDTVDTTQSFCVLLLLKDAHTSALHLCMYNVSSQLCSPLVQCAHPLATACWISTAPAALPNATHACVALASATGEITLLDLSALLDATQQQQHQWARKPASQHQVLTVSSLPSKKVCSLKEQPQHLSFHPQINTLLALGPSRGAYISLAADKRCVVVLSVCVQVLLFCCVMCACCCIYSPRTEHSRSQFILSLLFVSRFHTESLSFGRSDDKAESCLPSHTPLHLMTPAT